MHLPDDPFALVVPQTPDFRTDGWELTFGRYQWFYVVGAKTFMARAGLSDYSSAAERAGEIKVPGTWAASCRTLEWEGVASSQVRRAIHTKLQRFDKALLSIAAVFKAVTEGNPDFIAQHAEEPLVNFMQVKPATFEITGFDKATLARLDERNRNDLLIAGRQRHDHFLIEISKGHGATYPTLAGIAARLTGKSVRPKLERGNGTPLRPAQSETVTL